jgi:hypothetical protein
MKCNTWKVLLVFSALLMFAFTGELAAQTVTLTPETGNIYYGRTLILTASTGSMGDTVEFSILGGAGGSIVADDDTTDAAGDVTATFTAGSTDEDVQIEAALISGGSAVAWDTTTVDVDPAPETMTFDDPGYSLVPGEYVMLSVTLIDEDAGAVVDTVVNFTVLSGDGDLSDASDATNGSGVAVTELTANAVGTISVEASWTDGTIEVADTLDITVIDAPDQVTLNPPTASIALNADQPLIARALRSGAGVPGVILSFEVFPGLGGSMLSSGGGVSNSTGYVYTTYSAGTEAGTDTVVVTWTDEHSSLRATLVDTTIITVNPGAATSLDVTPDPDTTVVVTEDAIIVVELWDDFLNHVDATNPNQVSFSTSGDGSFGAASVNAETGCIEVAYTTDDIIATDTITTELLSNHTLDYNFVETIGAAPASMVIFAEADSEVVVGGNAEELECSLFDAYGNPSVFADFYAGSEEDAFYKVFFAVSEDGGDFDDDSVWVDEDGVGYNEYYSSDIAGVYTITATSGDAEATVDITQIPDDPDSVAFSLPVDTIGIPAAADTTLTALLYDQFGNYIEAVDGDNNLGWTVTVGTGSFGTATVGDDNNWQNVFTSEVAEADTALAIVSIPATGLRSKLYDTLVVISAEPGDLHHFVLYDLRTNPLGDNPFYGMDPPCVSDGVEADTTLNVILLEAQDVNHIRIWTYENEEDTVDLIINETSAGSDQVTWFLPVDLEWTEEGPYSEEVDTIVGLSSVIPEGRFAQGWYVVALANQVAETVTVTATDTAGHTGTSPEMSWNPIVIAAFNVGLEGGATTMETNDPTNVEVTAIDMFGNPTAVGLPLNVSMSANRPNIDLPPGGTQLMETSVDLFPIIARDTCSGLIITIAALFEPSINGESYEITVNLGGIEEGIPAVSNVTTKFGSGDVLCAVAEAGEVTVKVYNKVGMEVGTLLSGNVGPGYYQLSLKDLNLASDVYFVVMNVAGQQKQAKVGLIK